MSGGAAVDRWPPAYGYRYGLPAGWDHLDLDPRRRHAAVRRLMRAYARRCPGPVAPSAAVEVLLRHELAAAQACGAERLSLLAQADPSGLVSAAITLTVRGTGESEAGSPPLDAPALRAQLEPAHRRELDRDPQAELAVVPLAQLDAVRRRWTDVLAGADGAQSRHRIWQLLVPWPGRRALALLTLSSPSVAAWALLEQTFDACARTFHWTWDAPGPSGDQRGPRSG